MTPTETPRPTTPTPTTPTPLAYFPGTHPVPIAGYTIAETAQYVALLLVDAANATGPDGVPMVSGYRTDTMHDVGWVFRELRAAATPDPDDPDATPADEFRFYWTPRGEYGTAIGCDPDAVRSMATGSPVYVIDIDHPDTGKRSDDSRWVVTVSVI